MGGGRTRAQRSPFPELDAFVPARGAGVVSARAVTACGVRAVSVTVGNGKQKIPLRPTTYSNSVGEFLKKKVLEHPRVDFIEGKVVDGIIREDGTLRSTGAYVEGIRTGEWSWYYKSGNIKEVVTFNKDKAIKTEKFNEKGKRLN